MQGLQINTYSLYIQYICTATYILYSHTSTTTALPYSGKFSRDKIFADGSKNENSRIKFSRMLA